MQEKTFFVAVDGETKGPYTAEQIHGMWTAGNLCATDHIFIEESQCWEVLAERIESLRPANGLSKLFKRPTEEQKVEAERATNSGCGCLLLGVAIVLTLLGGAMLFSQQTTITETSYEKQLTTSPKHQVYRDPYKVYTPEEERSLRQKTIDAHTEVISKDTTRDMTSSEVMSQRMVGFFTLLIGLALLFWALSFIKKNKQIAPVTK